MPPILEKEKHLPTDQFLGWKVVFGGVSIPFEKKSQNGNLADVILRDENWRKNTMKPPDSTRL